MNPAFFNLIPCLAALAGGIVTLIRPPGERMRNVIMHFAAGVVFALVAVELLPDIVERHAPLEVGIGFAAGTILMLGIRAWSQRLESRSPITTGTIPSGFVVAMGVDFLVDGVLLGLGTLAGERVGTLMAIVLSVELFSLGGAVVSRIGGEGVSTGKQFAVLASMVVTFLVGVYGAQRLLGDASPELLVVFLSFGLSALLFLVTEELLSEAHETEDTLLSTSMFFTGFLGFLLFEMSI
jgi:ZIP family zinc transporter